MLSAVFLDRDGVINENREDYVKSLDELKLLPGAVEAIARLSRAGFRIVIVSNQQGVGRGLIQTETLELINRKILDELAAIGAAVAGIYYCPHLKEEDCECRKPKPGLLIKASKELGIDLARSVLVGDSPHDVEAGRSVGSLTILVLSGKTRPEEIPNLDAKPHYVAADLPEATDWLLRRFRPRK